MVQLELCLVNNILAYKALELPFRQFFIGLVITWAILVCFGFVLWFSSLAAQKAGMWKLQLQGICNFCWKECTAVIVLCTMFDYCA